MTAYSSALATHQTLSANTVDTVTLTDAYASVEILNRDASSTIYFTIDNYPTVGNSLAPTVAGADCLVVAPGQALVVQTNSSGTVPIIVRLISAGAAAYSVTMVR